MKETLIVAPTKNNKWRSEHGKEEAGGHSQGVLDCLQNKQDSQLPKK